VSLLDGVDNNSISENVQELTTQVARPDLLLVGSLLHDIGKGRDGDHSVVGESLAVQIGRRLGFPEPDVATLGAVVRHHLLLPHTATRRDLEDRATITRVVETLDRSPLVLDLLEALAEADSLATGPGVWSPWKASLIHDLVKRCRALLAGEPLGSAAPRSGVGVELAAAVNAGAGPQVRITDDAAPANIVVAVPNRPGALSAAAGVLALHSLEVHAAELGTNGRRADEHAGRDVAVFEFTASPRFGGLPDPALLRADLVRVLDGTLELTEALARKERDYAPMMPSVCSPSGASSVRSTAAPREAAC